MDTRAYWKAFGERLRTVRRELKLTQREAAKVYQVSVRSYQRYEGGAPQVGYGFLRFAEAYGIDLNWLGGSDAIRRDA